VKRIPAKEAGALSNIVIAVKGTGGDLFPFSRIGALLKERGHGVVFIHGVEQPFHKKFHDDVVKMFGLHYVAIEPEKATPFEPPPGAAEDPWVARRKRWLADTESYGLTDELSEFIALAEYCRRGDAVLIVHKNMYLVAQAAAEKFGIPMVSVYPGPFHLASMPLLADVYRLRAESVNRFRAEIGLPPVDDWQTLIRSSDLNIGLWPDWYAPSEPCSPSPSHLAGFLSDYGDEPTGIPPEAEDFLAKDGPPVLITHGTTVPDRPGFFDASVEACRHLGLRAVLVCRYEELVPRPLPASVRWFGYLPLRSLMGRMRAVIHHGGMGTIAQALAAGIPQLALVFNYDRPDNGRRLRNLGVGQFLPAASWRPEPVAEALQGLLESPDVRRRCQEMSGRSSFPGAASRVCDIVESLIADRGEM
jgi:UDP:flavonoid glycosyltransferase YjiC (YdhE family)